MNKELIKKYKKEFDHYLKGGLLLVKYSNTKEALPGYEDWHEDDNVFESNMDYLIIINDEYCTYRKAEAEGKTIQFKPARNLDDFEDTGMSLDLYIKQYPQFGPDRYRIKPEEPEFKVGDWVIFKDETKHLITSISLLSYTFDDNFSCGFETPTVLNMKLWKAKPGEWCVMNAEPANDHYSFTVQKWTEDSKWTPVPYTGPLPHFIKE